MNYSKTDTVGKNTDDGIVICNEPFTLDLNKEKNNDFMELSFGKKTCGWCREKYPDIEKNMKAWIEECIGEKATRILWSNLSDNLVIEH